MASSSSLSNVVSTLVRAQMGSSVPSSITDEDLDRHIGEIILREAKAKAERYQKEGIRAYLPRTDPNAPKANKRFLSSIIKNTDEHNKSIQKIHEQIRQEREEQDRKEKMRRAKEAAAVRRVGESRSGRDSYHSRDDVSEDRWRPEDDDERERKGKWRKRIWEKDFEDDKAKETERRRRSGSVERKRYWDEDEDEYEERMRKYERSQRKKKVSEGKRPIESKSPSSPKPRSHTTLRSSPRSRSPRRHNDVQSETQLTIHDEELIHSKRHRVDHIRESSLTPSSSKSHDYKRRKRSTSFLLMSDQHEQKHHKFKLPSPSSSPPPPLGLASSPQDGDKGRSRPPSPSVEPPSLPLAFPSPSSKMDKYFEPDYDPRLDVAPLTSNGRLSVTVPATGLIDDPSWDSWEAMLELIKLKREDKLEKKRLEKLGLLPDEKRNTSGSGKKGKGLVSASVTGEDRGLMDITYTKRGTVREWDMGKEIV